MSTESRTSKSIKNAKVSFFYYFLMILLSFWSRKVFFQYLGSEVVGLESTAKDLFGFLSLAELGVGMSVTYFLYKPLHDKNYEEINRIVALQGWIYRRVAFVVIAGAIGLMCFFPMIFNDIKIPLWYAFATFSVLLLSSLLGYFVNYRQIVLNTDQKAYKVTRVTQGIFTVIKIIQLLLLPYVANPFVFYLLTTVICTILSCWWLNYTISKEYPWLNTSGYKGRELLKEYPGVIKKTSQLFIHKITTLILFNTTPLIMYSFSSLSVVAYYANYLLIISKFKDVISMVYSSMGAAIGSLIASGDKKRILRVFWELYDSRFCIAFIVLICIYFLSHQFIALWLGEEYLMSQLLLVLLIINQSIFITRLTVDHYINGYGLFSDVWSPMAEGALNLGGALYFGYLIGYEGVILGSILSQTLIICIWKPIFLFRSGLKESVWKYFIPVIIRYIIILVDVVLLTFLFNVILPKRFDNYVEFILYSGMVFSIVSVLLFGEFYIFSQGLRDFLVRVKGVIQHKYN